MSQANPEKITVRIPVLVSRTGAVQTGWFMRKSNGESSFEHDSAVDSFDDEDYKAGYAVVYVTAVIDETGLFRAFEAAGAAEVAS